MIIKHLCYTEYLNYGGLCRAPRDIRLLTPSGLKRSSGSSGRVCRGKNGMGRLQKEIYRFS